jgi:hypothetical protein
MINTPPENKMVEKPYSIKKRTTQKKRRKKCCGGNKRSSRKAKETE